MVEDWAQAAKVAVVVALITLGLIHPQKFGVQVTAERALRVDGFSSERAAEIWLMARATDRNARQPDAS